MRRILTFIALLWAYCATAQTADYAYPLRGVSGHCAANFGEIRPGHFHAGVDIKTGGEVGKPIIAAADGYISRIVWQAYGYGVGLYLTLKDGTVVVYGHLDGLRDDLQKYIREERYRLKANAVDRSLPSDRYPVHRGDVLGYSGNSGSSMGAHLHYEIRRPHTAERVNLVKEGIIKVEDRIPPRLLKLHYIEIDSLDGVCMHAPRSSYDILRYADRGYRLAVGDTLEVGRKGFFVLEASDRRDGVNNRFGVWRVTASCDDEPYFEYRMDGFTYSLGRYTDAVSDYSLKLHSPNEVIRLGQMAFTPDHFYTLMRDRGVIRAEAGATHTMHIDVEDDCGNRSELKFVIRGREEEFRAERPDSSVVLHPDRRTILTVGEWASVDIPAGVLFEKTFFHTEEKPLQKAKNKGVVALTPSAHLIAREIPMLHNATFLLKAEVAEKYADHTVMARLVGEGRYAYVGGRYADGGVRCKARSGGWMALVADTLPPTISPLFPKKRAQGVADLRGAKDLMFKVSDNFSGISSYSMSVDGRWVPCDRQPIRGEFFYRFDSPATGRVHSVELRARDNAGNTATWRGKFFR